MCVCVCMHVYTNLAVLAIAQFSHARASRLREDYEIVMRAIRLYISRVYMCIVEPMVSSLYSMIP